MLHYIALKSTDILKKNKVISGEKERIYIYGFELLYSFIISMTCMLIWSMVLGCLRAVIIFLLFFLPIRMVAGGYHAKSYGRCFLMTNSITLCSVALAAYLWKWCGNGMEYIMWGIYISAALYILKNGLIKSGVTALETDVMFKNKKYIRIILGLEGVVLVFMKIMDSNELIYTSIIASCVVAILIKISKKEEQRVWKRFWKL